MYAEHFPASLAALGPEMAKRFTHEEAQGLLYTFAGAWPVLGRDGSDPSIRFVYEEVVPEPVEVEGWWSPSGRCC